MLDPTDRSVVVPMIGAAIAVLIACVAFRGIVWLIERAGVPKSWRRTHARTRRIRKDR